jgi:protein-disulfide isomerase
MKHAALLLATAVSLAAQTPNVEGNPSSAVRVIIYEDLQCPDCANFRQMMDKDLLPKYKATVAFEHRDFPLPKHNWARRAAIAAKFFETAFPEVVIEFRKNTMAKQALITDETFKTYLSDFAKAHKVDAAKAVAALDDPTLIAEVEKGYREGIARGVAHTPTVLVNGEPFIEVFPVADVIKAIDRELAANKH